jgi:hypothetical protein
MIVDLHDTKALAYFSSIMSSFLTNKLDILNIFV